MKKSKFNLSYLNSTTGNAGYLIPFLLQPTLPNDTFRISLTSFIRAQPMLAPLMHEVKFITQYWFVPYRLLWSQWVEFITGGENLDSAPAFPVLPAGTTFDVGSLGDYFGFPTGIDVGGISALPFRAYNMIYNTRYRDEDLQDELPLSLDSGADNVTTRNLLSPSWKRDYFTTARPFTQRGSDISVPIVQSNAPAFSDGYILAPVVENLDNIHNFQATGFLVSSFGGTPSSTQIEAFERNIPNLASYFKISANQVLNVGDYVTSDVIPECGFGIVAKVIGKGNYQNSPFNNVGFNFSSYYERGINAAGQPESWVKGSAVAVPGSTIPEFNDPYHFVVGFNRYDNDPTSNDDYNIVSGGATAGGQFYYYLNTSSGSLNIRDLRASSALQRYAERSLLFGNRYEEFIQREFGISPRDSRIQRPEYLGGGSGTLQISEVLQTAEGQNSGVGTMRGHGVAGLSQRPIKFRCPEHGLIIGLLSIRPKPVYTQGVNREFLKKSRLDFFTPELANIGMQEVLQRELYFTADNENTIFGYSDRYQEYRYNQPKVTGEFRGTLDFWNMSRKFTQPPVLNSSFIEMKSSENAFKRPFASQNTHQFLMMLRNNIKAYRPIPKKAKNILK